MVDVLYKYPLLEAFRGFMDSQLLILLEEQLFPAGTTTILSAFDHRWERAHANKPETPHKH